MSFAAFVRERRYLHNVSPSIASWYTHALKWLPSESPSKDELKDAVMRMREKGLKATGCNSAILSIFLFLAAGALCSSSILSSYVGERLTQFVGPRTPFCFRLHLPDFLSSRESASRAVQRGVGEQYGHSLKRRGCPLVRRK